MSAAFFDFHGVPVEITAAGAAGAEVLANLKEDFGFFSGEPGALPVKIEVEVGVAPPPENLGPRLFSTRSCEVYGFGKRRTCVYGKDSRTEFIRDESRVDIKVVAPGAHEAYEQAYVAILSTVGETLDLMGWHRVHALGVEAGGKRVLFVLPRGHGKSALAAQFLERTGLKLFSDEMPVLKNGVVHPFPVRLALKEEAVRGLRLDSWSGARLFKRKIFDAKLLREIPRERVAAAGPLDAVVFGTRAGAAGLNPLEGAARFPFLARQWLPAVVAGLGLPQMAEMMLRIGAPLPSIALSRTKEALRCFSSARFFSFPYRADATVAFDEARTFLDRL